MRRKSDDYTAGELRSKIVVERPQYTPDDSGGRTKVWVEHVTFYAFVEEKSSRERYADGSLGRLRSEELWEFTTWFRSDILVTDRLVWAGRYWNIRDVENILNRNKFTRITAEAGVEQ